MNPLILTPGLVVVKVGGSLYDHPHLGPGLRCYVDSLDASKVLIVAGGGPFADVVRDLARRFALGDAHAHDLAMKAIVPAAYFLADVMKLDWLVPIMVFTEWVNDEYERTAFLDSSGFLHYHDRFIAPVPHTWDVTTDSIAALAAMVANARLILLKSTDIPPGTSWEDAAARGWVDAYFPTAVAGATFPVEAVNFRKWLDERFPPADPG